MRGTHGRDDLISLSVQFREREAVDEATPGEASSDAESLVAVAAGWAELVSSGVFQAGATSRTICPSARDDYPLPRKALAMPTASARVRLCPATPSPELRG